jgi:hypothetical protein
MVGQGNRIRTSRLRQCGFLFALFVAAVIVYALSQEDRAESKSDTTTATTEVEPESTIDVRQLIADEGTSHPLDPILLVAQQALDDMNRNVLDYTATLEKRERIKRKLGESQWMDIKILSRTPRPGSTARHPLHAYFLFVEPSKAAGRELIWIEGKNDGKLVAHEAGFMNLIRVNLAPDSGLAMQGNKYPASQVGLENLLQKLIEKGTRDRQMPDCKVEVIDDLSWEDRTVKKIIVIHEKKSPLVDFHRAEILFDLNLMLPVSYSAYLWPKAGSDELPLEEQYIYHDLKVNVGLTEADFDPDNQNYNFP